MAKATKTSKKGTGPGQRGHEQGLKPAAPKPVRAKPDDGSRKNKR